MQEVNSSKMSKSEVPSEPAALGDTEPPTVEVNANAASIASPNAASVSAKSTKNPLLVSTKTKNPSLNEIDEGRFAKRERERGTPIKYLLNPYWFLVSFLIVCCLVSTGTMLDLGHFLHMAIVRRKEVNLIFLVNTLFQTGLGSACALVSLLDPVRWALPTVPLLGGMGWTVNTNAFADEKYVLGVGTSSTTLTMAWVVAQAVACTTVLIFLQSRKSHPHGSLTTSARRRLHYLPPSQWYVPMAVALGLGTMRAAWGFLVFSRPSSSFHVHRNPSLNEAFAHATRGKVDPETASWLLQLLTGSNVVVAIAAFFALQADVWYAVGSGQVHMVAFDCMGILFHFVSPICVLLCRCYHLYGRQFWIQLFGASVGASSNATDSSWLVSEEEAIARLVPWMIGLLIWNSTVGVALLRDISPIADGYLFGKTYLHGQPNTRKVALTVKLSDLLLRRGSRRFRKEEEEDQKKVAKLVVETLAAQNVMLNVFVTPSEIMTLAPTMTILQEAGHGLGLILDESDESNITADQAVKIWNSISSLSPLRWYRSRRPLVIRSLSARHDAKLVHWSTRLVYRKIDHEDFRTKLLKDVRADVEDKGGGNVIDLAIDTDNRTEVHPNMLVRAAEAAGLLDDSQSEEDDLALDREPQNHTPAEDTNQNDEKEKHDFDALPFIFRIAETVAGEDGKYKLCNLDEVIKVEASMDLPSKD